jgi:hypothetical protein
MARRDGYVDLIRGLPSETQNRGFQLLGDVVFKDEQYVLDVVPAASVATIKGVIRVVNNKSVIVGYIPVYTSYA